MFVVTSRSLPSTRPARLGGREHAALRAPLRFLVAIGSLVIKAHSWIFTPTVSGTDTTDQALAQLRHGRPRHEDSARWSATSQFYGSGHPRA